jgi:hypothetical protein
VAHLLIPICFASLALAIIQSVEATVPIQKKLELTMAQIAMPARCFYWVLLFLLLYLALLFLRLPNLGHLYNSGTFKSSRTINTTSGIGIIQTNFSILKVTPPPPPCTARLLTDHSKTSDDDDANSNGWIKKDGSNNNNKNAWHWQWQLSSNVQQSCRVPKNNNKNTTNTLIPLQSTPRDIQNALAGKWILMVGDSSIRMLHDYLVGRWFGNYTHWPARTVTNHGPKQHSRLCRQQMEDCHYDVFYQGARVTFVWLNLLVSQKELKYIMERTIGTPDMVIAQHGYWEISGPQKSKDACRRNAEQVVTTITEWTKIKEMNGIYPHAYDHDSKKVWFSSYDKNFFANHDNLTDDGRIYDGTKKAEELGWDILDRTILVNPDTGKPEGAHPMNEVLEIQLEMLLLLTLNL